LNRSSKNLKGTGVKMKKVIITGIGVIAVIIGIVFVIRKNR